MSDLMRREAGFLEIDWPENYTSHHFVQKKKREKDIINPPFFLYQCEQCGDWKKVKVSKGPHGEETRYIWTTDPEDMNSVCLGKRSK